MIKICNVCNEEFEAKGSSKRCSEECSMIYRKRQQKEYRDNNRNKANIRSKRYDFNVKKKVMAYYGDTKCQICGESHIECLTIDHKNNDGAEHRRNIKIGGGKFFYRWLVKNNYPTDLNLRVLCYNCNCSINTHGYSPYEREEINGSSSCTH